MAFKALIFNGLKKKTEAMEIIKGALAKNMVNFTCWHVQGILYKSQKNYKAAK